ncbi:hypothetical protein E2C01_073429 [Portunus trituberculatus]|uniref:Uncharacterized protein n=1 Tax=Portunus trituberculatus TaxID=210409 RepID=A0A5B7I0M9_PORTR|nr:hypothetical protein [Portunus trituberculatus]
MAADTSLGKQGRSYRQCSQCSSIGALAEGPVRALPGTAELIVMSGRGVIRNPLFCTVNDNVCSVKDSSPA